MVTAVDVEEVKSDPIARKYLRRFVQSNEMLYNKDRWCLWLAGENLEELKKSPLLEKRLEGVAKSRRESPTLSVQRQAETPHEFTQNRQPSKRYFALPEVSGENREWIPGNFYEPSVIAGNKLIVWDTDQLWHFGYLQSSLYMGWIRTYCGRLKSDYSLSPGLVYFPFPFIIPSDSQKSKIDAAASAILRERDSYQGASLAELYDPARMPSTLRKKHHALDEIIDGFYGLKSPTEAQRMKSVLRRYEQLVSPLTSTAMRRGRAGRK
ncbi:hypothetical protein R1CP_40460 (plasmid) [Rhodococcus opacus]|uniref:Uncharacterized protein n=2 Tax=Rhodococcus opacus TaxID=37919 RepID=A0A1B1KJ89_RHOOP|nr:hypothetical protein R1CP_40460 [Rhodococcus opacus]